MTAKKLSLLEKLQSFFGLIDAEDEGLYDGVNGTRENMDMNKVFIFHPEKLNDVSQMVNYLKQGTICVVDLSNLDIDVAKSIKDHMQGATFYADGTVELLGANLFMFLPRNYESHCFKLDTKQIMDSMTRDKIMAMPA